MGVDIGVRLGVEEEAARMVCIVQSPMKKGNWRMYQLPFFMCVLWCFSDVFLGDFVVLLCGDFGGSFRTIFTATFTAPCVSVS